MRQYVPFLFPLLSTLLIVLKVTNVVDISWFMVLCPVLVQISILFISIIGLIILGLIAVSKGEAEDLESFLEKVEKKQKDK